MKEKTKQILRYVACGLGGLALGIGLLGGLSMCATSGNKTTESVNTILAKTPKGEQITTANGNYGGYTFSLGDNRLSSQVPDNTAFVRFYDWNETTADVSLVGASRKENMSLSEIISWARSYYVPNVTARSILSIVGRGNVLGVVRTWYFMTWYTNSDFQNIGVNGSQRPYVLTTALDDYIKLSTVDGENYWQNPNSTNILYEPTEWSTFYISFLSGDSRMPESWSFQDAYSIWSSNAYSEGYSAGETAGNSAGYSSGYSDGHTAGYSEGHTAGYSEGYDDAYAEKDSGIAFTSCGVYPNAHVTLQTDETIGNFKYMYLCHYITKPGYDEHTIYIMWTQNANTHQYLGEVIDRNDTDSYDPAVTLGSFTQEVTPSVTITATQDMEFSLWVGYITTFHNRGEVTNSILWFQGGTAESDMQIYQNGYDEGYQNGNQQGQETGYEQGYERGQEVGDAEGYSRGYTEGFNQTNTKNVFSLFTSAFDSVASFFDLKIFGFLPLYWFFLAPLFIALISLLMRMVKH